MKVKKRRLILLSDLWGAPKSSILDLYKKHLSTVFQVEFLDSRRLASINFSIDDQETIHQQFVNGGIELAIRNLRSEIKEKVIVLAFSIGGTIAWKAANQGWEVEKLYAVSATRLRYELEKPNCQIKLFFGQNDGYKPESKWYKKRSVDFEIIKGGHSIYLESSFVESVCNEIVNAHQKR